MLTALVFLTEMGDLARFANRRQIGAYLGLVPRSYESGAAGDRIDGQRWIDAADGRKHRAVADPQIRDIPRAAVGIDDASARIGPHADGAVEMAGVVGLVPEFNGPRRVSREMSRKISRSTRHGGLARRYPVADLADHRRGILVAQ